MACDCVCSCPLEIGDEIRFQLKPDSCPEVDMSEKYWVENYLPLEWTPIGDKGLEYRFQQVGDWPVWHCYFREWIPHYETWSESVRGLLTVSTGMTEDVIRTKLFRVVYELEKAYNL